MNKTSKELFDELHTLSKSIQHGLNETLVFGNRLSRFDKQTLMLFIALTSSHSTFGDILKLLEELERHCSKKTTVHNIESNPQKRQPPT